LSTSKPFPLEVGDSPDLHAAAGRREVHMVLTISKVDTLRRSRLSGKPFGG